MSATAMTSAIVVIGVLTYLTRAGFILFFADRPLPAPVVKALRNVGPAVLSALTISMIAGGHGVSGISGEELAGVVAGCVAAAWSRNLIVSLAAGMCAVWVAAALL